MGLFQTDDKLRHCRRCEHWGDDVAGGSHALCLREDGRRVQANPEQGCVYWVRAIGVDDEEMPGRAMKRN
jgi:hypothetical protein